MKSRAKLLVIALFGLISLFSIGFAAWTVTKPLTPQTSTIDMLVFEPHDNAKYIEILGSSVFDFYNTGFVVNNDTITHNGTITAEFKFNVKEFKESFGETGVTIELLFKHATGSSDYDMFAESAPFTISSTVNGELGGNFNSVTSTQGCLTTITLDTLPAEDAVTFTVTYDLQFNGIDSDVSDYLEFKSEVFEKIQNVLFAVEAKVTSK